MVATMFLNNITAIDHAYIDESGQIIGDSYQYSCEVFGKVDPVENVVVDFSTIKKKIKALIDDNESGFDHKLWVINGFSLISQVLTTTEGVHLKTPAVELKAPKNALKLFEGVGEDKDQIAKSALDSYLNSKLAKLYPDVSIKLTPFLSRSMAYPATNNPTAYKRFNYVHGLKESTSWGCKNIAHGHYSYLALEVESKEGLTRLEGSEWFKSLDESLNNLHFIWQANQVSDTKHEYLTQDRGKFELILLGANAVTITRETTIENLVDWFVDKHRNELLTYNVKKVYMSEGLTKGAVMVIEND